MSKLNAQSLLLLLLASCCFNLACSSTEINFNFNNLFSGNSRPVVASCASPSPSPCPSPPLTPSEAVLYAADTSRCLINTQMDQSAIIRGEANFATFILPNQDLSCSADPSTGIMTIAPSNGVNFTVTLPGNGGYGPTPGGDFEHIKTVMVSAAIITPITDGVEVCNHWVANVRRTGVDLEPFGAEVTNVADDVRLGTASMLTIDLNSLMTFDFLITDTVAYVLIERLPGNEAAFGYTYAAYSFVYPALQRNNLSNEYHEYQTCYNRKENTLRWSIDGNVVLKFIAPGMYPSSENVFSVNQNGDFEPVQNPKRFYLAYHGGFEPAEPIPILNLNFGLGLFTLLDMLRPNNIAGVDNKGLVRLEVNKYRNLSNNTILYYNDPFTGQETQFVDDCSLASNGVSYETCIPPSDRLFGSGVSINLKQFYTAIQFS